MKALVNIPHHPECDGGQGTPIIDAGYPKPIYLSPTEWAKRTAKRGGWRNGSYLTFECDMCHRQITAITRPDGNSVKLTVPESKRIFLNIPIEDWGKVDDDSTAALQLR